MATEEEQLKEALRWAVEFIRCNVPNSQHYPDFANADALATEGSMFGPFQSIRAENELMRYSCLKAQKAIQANLARWAYKDEQVLYEAYKDLEQWTAPISKEAI